MTTTTPRRALVTGASSGIGRATARRLAAAGYQLILLARRAEGLAAVSAEIEAQSTSKPLCIACDLREPEQIVRAFARVTAEIGALDLLVNCAGIGYRARVEELDATLLRQTFDTNVIGLFLCCHSALPLLRLGRAPVVINVASVVGRRGIPGQAAYSASKAAVVSFGEALRLEWAGEGIAVCTLSPGLTATGFFEAQPNPSELAAPDLSQADGPDDVAAVVWALDRAPRPEVWMRKKWRWLALLSLVAPGFSDRVLVKRLGWSPVQSRDR